MNVRPCHRYYG